jgi:maleylpyruvate isomerase
VVSGTPDDVGPIDVEAEVAECRGAHARLFATVDTLDDSSRPSRLPGWSVGHVLTHLARNADSHVRVLEAARQARAVEQYAGGRKQRADDIEAGAGRALADIVEDLRESVGRLEHRWASMTAEDWNGHGLAGGKPWPCREMVPSRLAEVVRGPHLVSHS